MAAPVTSQYIVVQVADTRFAVRCSYPPFMSWLAERCRGFISQGEPHLRLDITLNSVQRSPNSGDFLSVATNGNHDNNSELKLSVAGSCLAYAFGMILHICLRCAIPAKQPPDLLLHSAGVIREGMAYLFLGPSGSGKSTVCTLLARDSSFTVLHDEIIAIAQTDGGFRAWSTPLPGERPNRYSRGAPLKAAFFLNHDRANYATRLSGSKAAGQLTLSLVPPYVATNGHLKFEPAESFRLALLLAERIPCYELHFRPEWNFWECIPPLLEKEKATAGQGRT